MTDKRLFNHAIGIAKIINNEASKYKIEVDSNEISIVFTYTQWLSWEYLEKISAFCVKNEVNWQIGVENNQLAINIWNEDL